jgi:hypothetical protein
MQERLSRLRAHIQNRAQNLHLPQAQFDFTVIINAAVIIVGGVVGAIFRS